MGSNLPCFSQEYKLKIFSKDSLENVILKKINYKKEKQTELLIQNELDSILKSIFYLGYLNAKIISKTKKDSIIRTEFKLNNKIEKTIINFKENDLLNEFIKLEEIQVTNNKISIPFLETSTFIKKVMLFYKKNGYPFIKINYKNHQIQNNKLITDLIIHKNNSRKIDSIIIKGYNNFPNNFLKFYLNFSKNKTYNKAILTKINTKANTIPFATRTKKTEVLFLKDSTLIYIYLQKKKTSQFDGLIGFSSNDKSKLVFSGHLNLKLNNLFNRGELIELLWKSNEKENKYFDMNVDFPYVFNSRINPKINFSIYSQDTSFVNVQTKIAINYILNSNHKIGLITSFENSNNLLKNEIENIIDYKANLYGIEYEYKIYSTDIFYKNKRLINFFLKRGVKNTNDKKNNKTEIQLNLSYLINLGKRINVNLNNYSAINITDDLLENELYKIGGTLSIRGFSEKSIASSKYSILTTDINYKINKKTYLYSIIDYGQTYNTKYNNLISLGLGYKTKLKSSILNINYSMGKTQDIPLNFKKALLNISFINYF